MLPRIQDEQVLRSDSIITQIVSCVQEAFVVLDNRLRVRSGNEAFFKLFQIPPNNSVGQSIFELGSSQLDCPQLRHVLEEVVLLNSKITDFQISHDLEHIGKRTLKLNVRTVVSENTLNLICLAIEDVTGRQLAAAELERSECQLRTLVDHAPTALAMFDREMRYLIASQRMMHDYQLGERDLIGQSHYEVFPSMPDEWKIAHRRGLEGEIVRNEEDKFVRDDGSVYWMRWEVRPWFEPNGDVGGIVIFTEEITERKRVEAEKQDSQLKLLSAMNSMSDAVCIMNVDGQFIDFNDAYVKFHHFKNREEVWRTLDQVQSKLEIMYPDGTILPTEMWLVPRALRGEKGTEEQYTLCRKDTGVCWIGSFNFGPMCDQNGEIVGAVVVCRDVTDRVYAETALRDSQNELQTEHRALIRLNLATSGLWNIHELQLGLDEMLRTSIELMKADFGNIQLFDSKRQILTIAAQHGFSSNFLEFFREVDVSDGCDCGRALLARKRLIIPDIDCDDEYAAYLEVAHTAGYRAVQSTPLFASDGTPLGMVSTYWRVPHRPKEQDLHRLDLYCIQGAEFILRCRSEQALRDREENLRAVLNTAADAIITITKKGVIVSVNAATEKMFGFNRNELVGKNVSILMPEPHSSQHDAYLRNYLETRCPRVIGIGRETIAKRKDGSIFPIDLAVSEVDHLGLFTGIIRDISDRKRMQREILAIIEEEQCRIGQDLHDGAQQEVAGVGLLVSVLMNDFRRVLQDKTEAKTENWLELAQRLQAGLKRAQEEIRNTSRGLNPIQLESDGLNHALRDLAHRTDDLHGIRCTFDFEQSAPIQDESSAIHLYRIAQESVTNAVKHAQPLNIFISLNVTLESIILRISDDGIGFEQTSVANGIGLKTMKYRADMIGGTLMISPKDHGGTVVTCRLSQKGFQREHKHAK